METPHANPAPWSRCQAQAFDSYLQHLGIPPIVLMEQASRALLEQVDRQSLQWPASSLKRDCLILAGPGNNGADGIALARQMLGHPQLEPRVWLFQAPPAPESLLARQFETYRLLGGTWAAGLEQLQLPRPEQGLVVDALFGLGLQRPIEGPYAKAISHAMAAEVPVLAVDQPSGLDSDLGTVWGTALAATWTVAFAAPRTGFTLNQGPRLCGKVFIAQLGVQAAVTEAWATTWPEAN